MECTFTWLHSMSLKHKTLCALLNEISTHQLPCKCMSLLRGKVYSKKVHSPVDLHWGIYFEVQKCLSVEALIM